jgi:O-methyltransferase
MVDPPAELYLDLLKRCLTRWDFGEEHRPISLPSTRWKARVLTGIDEQLHRHGMRIVTDAPFDPKRRQIGKDWPVDAETMVGLTRLDNVQQCVTSVIRDDVPGDLFEAGVWRGGVTILMRAVLAALGISDRRVWVADSFQGLPAPDGDRYPADAGDTHFELVDTLGIPLEQVQENFRRYGLLDDQVQFLPGWFRDTLPTASVDRIAVLRLDGDMYESTIVALDALYPKLSVGGYLILDDYLSHPACREAVTDYRSGHEIVEPIVEIDWTGVFWRRER